VGIYGLQNKLFPNKWNIGQSHDICGAWETRYKPMRCKNQKKIYHALLKYGYDGFEKRIIEMCDENIPQEMLDKKEIAWINHYNSIDNGYNIAAGGKVGIGFGGRKHTPESKAKIIASNNRRKVTDETRTRMSNALKGRKWTKSQRDNITRGKQLMTAEKVSSWKKNLSISGTGKKRPPVTDVHRTRLRLSHIGLQSGENNPCFGKRWITDGITNKYVNGVDDVPIGWKYGKTRTVNKLTSSV
jgi:group I intron endonuclease